MSSNSRQRDIYRKGIIYGAWGRLDEARALYVKAKVLYQTRPNMARQYLERALALSSRIGTRILAEGIRRDMEIIQ